MKQEVNMLRGKLMIILLSLGLAACSGDLGGTARVEVSDVGFSMSAPRGWKVKKDAPWMCAKGENTGIVMVEPLNGKNFAESAEALSKVQGATVISKSSAKIGVCEAIEAVIVYPGAGSKAMKVYVHKDDKLIEVSFVTPEGDFSKHEESFREAIGTIKIK
jgi:hypothetical protein